ncbi:MAG: hypothetical protein M3Q31_02245 [Actinomycetota bacterium]|nr:hypothetical protein [Actinomycetota bacterium]
MRTDEREILRRRCRRLPAGVVVTAALVAFAVVGCGGGSGSPGVASIATTTSADQPAKQGGDGKASAKHQTFSACMRAHGVPNFPDANSNGGIAIDANSGVDPSSPQFQAAQKACQKLAPNGGKPPSPAEQAKAQQQALKFSACMRSHGVPNFPDPKFSGGMTQISIDAKNGGIDPGSPIFQSAQKTCQKLMPGRPGGPGGGPTTHVGGNGPASGGATQTGGAGK